RIGARTETTEAGEELKTFYADAGCRPVWIDENGVNAQALYLIHEIREGYREGLDSYNDAYNLESILTLMGRIKSDASYRNDPAVAAQLDILLTDAYMMLGEHLYRGALPPEVPFEPWKIALKDSPGMGARLRQALETNTLSQSLERLAPRYPDYLALKRMLERYLRIQEQGGWKRIESVTTDPVEVERYYTDELKERLRAEGDLGEEDESSEGFRSAIIDFQTRHGLKPDGKVGSETLLRLNITVEEKIAAIRMNLERWRWMPETMERSYIAVNIPGFYLSVIENGEPLFGMKAIVGKPERPTPIFSAWMTYIVARPYWRVPATILREDIFPSVRKNIGYLKKERIRIFRHGDETGANPINPYTINWAKADPDAFPYYLRQDAGPKNSLGLLKFMFPNGHDVYIHDTPYKTLFDKTIRSFSSGCIRAQEPIVLADYLLERDGNDQNVENLIEGRSNRNIFLSRPLKVYITYWTAWEDEAGKAHFRDDVYGYDNDMAAILGW
ncbi:MAG: L,D-transpeptidase family protein, partial [Campylobacterales bacterium]|nr:L,D-transpeptidase family protein [Campylobacterales bacterium]